MVLYLIASIYLVRKLVEKYFYLLVNLTLLNLRSTSNVFYLYLSGRCYTYQPGEVLALGRVLIINFKKPINLSITVLFLSQYLTHHREDLYAEPNCFKPERFLERKFSRFEYFPFGGSHRSCMGMIFAQIQIKLVVATILSIFQLEIVNRHPVKPLHKGIFGEASPSNLWMICK